MKRNYRAISYILTVIFSVLLIWAGYLYVTRNGNIIGSNATSEPIVARVDAIVKSGLEDTELGGGSYQNHVTHFFAEILKGEGKGKVVLAYESIDVASYEISYELKVGDKIYLNLVPNDEDDGYHYISGGHLRQDSMFALIGLFFVLLIVFGRSKGVNTVVSLVFTCAAVFLVLIPAVANGENVYLWTLIVCAFTTLMTLMIVIGPNRKSFAASLGCIGGVCVAGLLTLYFNSKMFITGMTDEDAFFVLTLNPDHIMDLRGILFAGILIGAMGATMDVAMSIASSLSELIELNPEMKMHAIIRSGMNIGRDIMGTMANTLILAYVGGSLNTIMLLLTYQNSLPQMLNLEMIATEVLKSVGGSIGILFTIPITAVITAVMHHKKKA